MSSDPNLNKQCVDQLKWALQALAAPAEYQLSLFPDFVVHADELALDFADWYEVAKSRQVPRFTAEQARLLDALNARLEALSRGGPEFDPQFWSADGLRSSERWKEVRSLAGDALLLLGWPQEAPPHGRSQYVPGGRLKSN
jgi:hypothetical protein